MNYLKFFSILAFVGLVSAVIIGFLTDFLFYSILLYITILVSAIGYVGGVWLWEYLASSELIKGKLMRIIKIVGIFALLGFVTFICISIYIAFYGDFILLNSIVTNANYLLLFMFTYFLGYLLSIWNPTPESEIQEESQKRFQLEREVIKKVGKIALPVAGIGSVLIVIVGLIIGDLIPYLFYCGIYLLVILGFCLGYLVWEHLKKSDLLKGEFQKKLKWISIASTIVLGGLMVYGFWVVSLMKIVLYQELILYYTIFIICMFFYFLGLYVSVIKSK